MAGSAHAVLLNLDPNVVPDAKSKNWITYQQTDWDGNNGFTMNIGGGWSEFETINGEYFVQGTGEGGAGNYSLTAYFDNMGVFQAGAGGTVLLTYTNMFPIGHSTPGPTGGILASGDLTEFGWGGFGAAGVFEFTFDWNGPSDYRDDFGGAYGGTRISTFDLSELQVDGNDDPIDTHSGAPSYAPTALLGIGDWDLDELMKMEFATPDVHFGGNNNTSGDTFIPVPAAIWFMGSALAMLGMLRRRFSGGAQPA